MALVLLTFKSGNFTITSGKKCKQNPGTLKVRSSPGCREVYIKYAVLFLLLPCAVDPSLLPSFSKLTMLYT